MNLSDSEIKQFMTMAKFNAVSFARNYKIPPSIEFDDLVQQVLLKILEIKKERPDLPKAYFEKIAPFILSRFVASVVCAPSFAMRRYYEKKGENLAWGEISIDVFANNAGLSFDEWLSDINDEEEKEVSFITLTLDQAAECLRAIRKELKNPTLKGISLSKTRNKYHVEVLIMKQKQFIGQYKTLEEAIIAKADFLEKFFDAVLDATETGDDFEQV
jgi:hypothetical protein